MFPDYSCVMKLENIDGSSAAEMIQKVEKSSTKLKRK
jgi:predicted secreted Zn-dependent protease